MSSLIKAILRFFKKLLRALKKVLGKLMKNFNILLVIFIIACCMFPAMLPALLAYIGAPAAMVSGATAFAATVGAAGSITWWCSLAVGTGVCFLLAPNETKEVIGKVAEAAKDVASAVGGAVGGVVSGGTAALAKSILPAVLIGLGGFLAVKLILSSGSKEKEKEPAQIAYRTTTYHDSTEDPIYG